MSDFGDDTVDTAAVASFLENDGEEFLTDPAMEADPSTPAAPNEDDNAPPATGLDAELPDFSDLDPAQRAFLEKRVNDWRADWTQKTTKLADANRILTEAGGDPQAVLDAYEFAQALENDPEVRARLYQALAAEQQPQTPTPPVETQQADPFSEYDLPPEILGALQAVPGLEARLAAFEANQQAAAQEAAQQQYLQEVVQDLSSQYDSITQSNPDLLGTTPEEAQQIEEEIFAYGAHTNGNLAQALDLWRRAETRAQARLFEGSANVPGGVVSPPAGGGHSTEPVVIETIKDAGAAAKEFLEQYMQD